MEKEEIRKAIAKDLRGKPSRNPDSLVPDIVRELNFNKHDVSPVMNELHQMQDLGHVVLVGLSSIRLSEEGERYYFATPQEKTKNFLAKYRSDIIAILAFLVSIGVAIFK